MTVYASGRSSVFICDQCSWEYPYLDRKKSSYNTIVCPVCFDGSYDLKNHPQNDPPPVYPDPQAIVDPRPDVDLAVSYEPVDGDEMMPLYVGGGGP